MTVVGGGAARQCYEGAAEAGGHSGVGEAGYQDICVQSTVVRHELRCGSKYAGLCGIGRVLQVPWRARPGLGLLGVVCVGEKSSA